MSRTPTSVPAVLTIALLLAASLAGCLEGASPLASASTDPAAPVGSGSTTPAGDPGAGMTSSNATAFLAGDGTFLATAPAEAGWRTVGEPVNSPMAREYAVWEGVAPVGANATNASITFYITSNTAALAANTVVPMFEASFWVELTIGDTSFWGESQGPAVLHTGKVDEITIPLATDQAAAFAPGDPMWLQIIPVYSHVAAAAEVRILTGADTPSGLTFG